MSKRQIQRVVLAYSGGLDTSVIVPWLRENYGCEVICFTADIGQGDELTGLEAKTLASGASQFILRDLREEFARDYLLRVPIDGQRQQETDPEPFRGCEDGAGGLIHSPNSGRKQDLPQPNICAIV